MHLRNMKAKSIKIHKTKIIKVIFLKAGKEQRSEYENGVKTLRLRKANMRVTHASWCFTF